MNAQLLAMAVLTYLHTYTNTTEALYLRWNELYLIAYFETIMNILQSKRFSL